MSDRLVTLKKRTIRRRVFLGLAIPGVIAGAGAILGGIDQILSASMAMDAVRPERHVPMVEADVVIPPDVKVERGLYSRMLGSSPYLENGGLVVRRPLIETTRGRSKLLFAISGGLGRVELDGANRAKLTAERADDLEAAGFLDPTVEFSKDLFRHIREVMVHQVTQIPTFPVLDGEVKFYRIGMNWEPVPMAYVKNPLKP